MEKENTSGKKHRRKIFFAWIVSIAFVLILFRIFLPYIILREANKKLAHLQGYYGHIRTINVALYRGAYVIKDINIFKIDTVKKDSTHFFSCNDIDISVQWKALFKGKIVGEVNFEKPIVKYTLNKTIGKNRQKDTVDFIQLVKDFHPLKINRFTVDSGEIHYMDFNRTPNVDIFLHHLFVEARGLSNESTPNIILPANIDARGNLYDGTLNLWVQLDPLNKVPTFDLKGELTETNLVKMNEFFKAYGNFTLNQGTMSLYTEYASRDNYFRGYAKPLIKDFKVKQGEGNIGQMTWELFVGAAAQIFKNQKKDQLATRIPVEGKYTKTDIGILDAILSLLKNAFIEALKPTIENSVNISNVKESEIKKNFFQKIFGGEKKEENKKEKPKEKKKKEEIASK